MNRGEAVACYKEILSISEYMGLNSIKLSTTKTSNLKIPDYEIRVSMLMGDEIKAQITEIAEKHKCAVKEEKDEEVICSPYFLEISIALVFLQLLGF